MLEWGLALLPVIRGIDPSPHPIALSPPVLIQEELYFSQCSPSDRILGQQFQAFLQQMITPRFPDGLTGFPARPICSEQSSLLPMPQSFGQVVSLLHANGAPQQQAIGQIIADYQQRFPQSSVLRVTNADLTAVFDPSLAAIDSDTTPEWIQVDLYFGRNIGQTQRVTERQFQAFVNQQITPRFPDGLTLYNAAGQYLDSQGNLILERSKVVTLILEDTQANEAAIDQIMQQYQQQYQQEAVLEVVNEAVQISFDAAEDAIENDPVPQPIQVDLYFGRNIGETGRVTKPQFQAFVAETIAPRFPSGVTIYDAAGQYLDSQGRLIREPSQVVSLITTDTPENERAIDAAITAYQQQFQQESVLQVVDETIQVSP